MSAFIVSGGSLLEIGCPSALSRATEQQVSRTVTLGGKVKVFARRGGRRSWSIEAGVARPSEVSTIEAVARNLGPVGWYGPEAVIGNLLSPQASGWEPTPGNGTDAGLVQLPDGTVARSLAHSGSFSSPVNVGDSAGIYEPIPVKPGTPLSLGVWGFGGSRISGAWRDAVGSNLGNELPPAFTFTGWQWRQVTLNPPAGAVAFQMLLTQGTQYALPSASWGDVAKAEIGTGCPKAIIHSPQHSPIALWQGANYTDSSYTVTEVG